MVCVEKVKLDGWACMAQWAGWSERSYSPKGVGPLWEVVVKTAKMVDKKSTMFYRS